MEVFKFYLVCFILIAQSVKIGQFLGWRGSSNRGSTPLLPTILITINKQRKYGKQKIKL